MQLNLTGVNWRVLILIQVLIPGFPVLCLLACDIAGTSLEVIQAKKFSVSAYVFKKGSLMCRINS